MARMLVIAVFVIAFFCIARGDDGTCGLTGLKPKMPSMTMARCPDATKSACCGDCGDMNLILQAMSADGISIVNQIAPGAGTLLGKTNFHVCDLFNRYAQCQFSIEALFCALECNADSGKHVTKNNTAIVLNICDSYAKKVFQDCKKLSFPNLGEVSSFYNTPADFLNQIFAAVVRVMGVKNFTTAVLPDASNMCYTGPKLLPSIPICCDTFSEAKSCPAGTISPKYNHLVGQKVNATNCAAFKDVAPPTVVPNKPSGNSTLPPGVIAVNPSPTTPSTAPDSSDSDPPEDLKGSSSSMRSVLGVLAPVLLMIVSLL